MKLTLAKTVLLACLLILAGAVTAQPPAGVNITSVAKDPLGNIAKNRNIYVKDIIYQKAPVGGVKVWEETHLTTSNDDGVFNIVVGRGKQLYPGNPNFDIGMIDWANGPFFYNYQVAVAPSIPAAWWVASDNYVDMGTSQILSGFYALYAGNATVNNVTTSISPGPPNTFLITDSTGNVSWTTPKAAQQTVTTITNFTMTLNVIQGQNVVIPANTSATVSVPIPGVKKGDPILVTPQDDYPEWTVYAAWVSQDNTVKVRFANFTDLDVRVLGSQYKIVVMK